MKSTRSVTSEIHITLCGCAGVRVDLLLYLYTWRCWGYDGWRGGWRAGWNLGALKIIEPLSWGLWTHHRGQPRALLPSASWRAKLHVWQHVPGVHQQLSTNQIVLSTKRLSGLRSWGCYGLQWEFKLRYKEKKLLFLKYVCPPVHLTIYPPPSLQVTGHSTIFLKFIYRFSFLQPSKIYAPHQNIGQWWVSQRLMDNSEWHWVWTFMVPTRSIPVSCTENEPFETWLWFLDFFIAHCVSEGSNLNRYSQNCFLKSCSVCITCLHSMCAGDRHQTIPQHLWVINECDYE